MKSDSKVVFVREFYFRIWKPPNRKWHNGRECGQSKQ